MKKSKLTSSGRFKTSECKINRVNSRLPNSVFMDQIPPETRWKADNLNNLMEQPTYFYAVVIILALLDAVNVFNVALAWIYVGLRVVHSLVQVTVNRAMVRFGLFVAGSLVLMLLTIRAAIVLVTINVN